MLNRALINKEHITSADTTPAHQPTILHTFKLRASLFNSVHSIEIKLEDTFLCPEIFFFSFSSIQFINDRPLYSSEKIEVFTIDFNKIGLIY